MKQLLIYCYLLLPFFAIGQPYKAVHISVADGLSQSSVYDIVQDKSGFIWMATQDGLNRYDGTSFQVFRDEPFDTNSISSNNLSALLCDSNGRIWAGTANHGLNLYIPAVGFRHFLADGKPGSLASNMITALHQDANGAIWVGTGNGLHRLKETRSQNQVEFVFDKIPLKTIAEDTIADKFINVIASGNRNDLWVGTFAGLFKIHTADKPVQEKWYSKKNNLLEDAYVYSITLDKSGRVWAGGRNGIVIIDPLTQNRITISKESVLQEGMVSNLAATLFTASNGDIWVGYNDRGVQVIRASAISNIPNGKLKFEKVDAAAPVNALENGRAISFWEDKITRGIIWTGFNAGGLVRLVPVTKKFTTNKLAGAPLPTAFVTSVIKDHLQQVWVGTTTGLLMYDRFTKKYRSFLPSAYSASHTGEDYINGLASGPDGSIYFGARSELFNVTKSGVDYTVTAIPFPDEIEGNLMRTIVKDDLGRIYVILRYSVYEFDHGTKKFLPVIKIEDQKKLLDRGFYLSAFFVDSGGNYWLGTSSGLEFYAKNKAANNLSRKQVTYNHNPKDTNSLRNHNILCIAQDKNGYIWLGTMNGLTRVVTEEQEKRFLNYSTRNGLKNNVIYSIIPDSRTGNIWLSTNNGLTEFDPVGTAIATYDVHDGLQSNEFNSYASYKAPDGEMFFGGIEGYTSFYPEQIRRDNTSPFVAITNLVLEGNKMINLSDFQQSKTIELKYKDNTFTVNFIGLHYVDPQKNQYAYQLEGFQKDWTYSGNSNRVNFSQLPPGRYIFKVKAANSDGVYNTSGDMFTIIINPPFYKSIWFYLVIAVFITGVLWGLHKYRLSMKLAQVREVEQLRRATAADFHDELGHKLTIISWFAEILKKKIGPEQVELRPHLDRIIDASGTLYHTMKDMLWAMDPDKDSVYDLYSQIREFGLELFDNTGVLFDAEEIAEDLKTKIISPAHKRHVLLIFKEVMNNSLKHAHSSTTHLDLVRDDSRIKFRFRDNGKGFKMNGHNVGHGLNNVKRRAQMIDADIHIHSEGDGTVAELDLQMNNLN